MIAATGIAIGRAKQDGAVPGLIDRGAGGLDGGDRLGLIVPSGWLREATNVSESGDGNNADCEQCFHLNSSVHPL
jgi:hypothetical protein